MQYGRAMAGRTRGAGARMSTPSRPSHFGRDGFAAIAVLSLMVPQAMAYALIIGLSPITGFFSAAAGALAYAPMASSRYLSVGPVALTCLVAASGLQTLATADTPRYAALALVLGILVGLALLVLGSLRAGVLVNFLGHPAIVGFNAAAALLTAASQLRPLLGLPASAAANVTAENPWPILVHVGRTQPLPLAFGLATLAIMLGLPRWRPRVPAPLVACGAGIVACWMLGGGSDALPTVGAIPVALPQPRLPDFSMGDVVALVPTALSVTIVGYGSSVAIAKALAVRRREQIHPNRELFALGFANLASAAVGGFPVSGGLSRTAVALNAGGHTRKVGVFVGIGVVVTMFVAGPVFALLPHAVLAGIVIHAALGLFDPREATEVWRTHRSDGVVMVATAGVTLTFGLVNGLAAGLAVALVLFVRRTATPHTAELGRIPGSLVYRNTLRETVDTCPQIGILRVDAPLYFANARFLEDRIHQMFAQRPQMQILALDCAAISDIDATAVGTLRNLVLMLRSRGNDLHLIGPIGPVRDVLARTRVDTLLGPANIHRTILEAAATMMAHIDRRFCEERCQSVAFSECSVIPRSASATGGSEAARFSPQI